MIKVSFFYLSDGKCKGFKVEGHANSAQYGSDLVCCAVSVAVQMCCNGITDVLNKKARVKSLNGLVEFDVVEDGDVVQFFLKALELELFNVAQDHKTNLKVVKLEV